MSTGSADGFRLSGSFEGCISGHDSNVSHRPYHKNCRCALHDKSRRRPGFPPPPLPARCNSVSYPIRRSRSESSLAFSAAASPLRSFPSSPVAGLPSSPSLTIFQIYDQEDDDDDDHLFQISS